MTRNRIVRNTIPYTCIIVDMKCQGVVSRMSTWGIITL